MAVYLVRSGRVARHDGAQLQKARRLRTQCLSGVAAEALRPAQASDASSETHPTPHLSANPGECPFGIRAYPTPGYPYLFGMVKNSEPSHKCHRAMAMFVRHLLFEAHGMTEQKCSRKFPVIAKSLGYKGWSW